MLPNHALLAGLLISFVFVVACDSDTERGETDALPMSDGGEPDAMGDGGEPDAMGDTGAAGLAPGTSCVLDSAGDPVTTDCLDNPALPTCHQCLNQSGTSPGDYVCAFSCRIGEDDCPSGQACTATSNTRQTGFQDCRDLTDGYEVGYCS